MYSKRRSVPIEDFDHPNTRGINSQRIKKMNLRMINLLRQKGVTTKAGLEEKGGIIIRVTITRRATIKVSISGSDRCTQRINQTGGVLFRGLKTPNPHREVKSVVIHIYFSKLHDLFFFCMFAFCNIEKIKLILLQIYA